MTYPLRPTYVPLHKFPNYRQICFLIQQIPSFSLSLSLFYPKLSHWESNNIVRQFIQFIFLVNSFRGENYFVSSKIRDTFGTTEVIAKHRRNVNVSLYLTASYVSLAGNSVDEENGKTRLNERTRFVAQFALVICRGVIECNQNVEKWVECCKCRVLIRSVFPLLSSWKRKCIAKAGGQVQVNCTCMRILAGNRCVGLQNVSRLKEIDSKQFL